MVSTRRRVLATGAASMMLAAMLVGQVPTASATTPANLGILPAPQSVTTPAPCNNAVVSPTSRIVYPSGADASGFVTAMAAQIKSVTGLTLAKVAGGTPAPGDIVLTVGTPAGTPAVNGAYTLTVDQKATLTAVDQDGLATASASLLQLLNQSLTLPCTTIADYPESDFRGLMIDLGRGYWTPAELRNMVELAHLYKVKYLHLHLTENENWMFPSTAYPLLGSQNQSGHPAYTKADLQALDAFAWARGVTIIPEIEVPGHATQMVNVYPAVFGPGTDGPFGKVISHGSSSVRAAVKTIIGEMLDVFTHTPYFHLGGDESGVSGPALPDFLNELNDYVRGRGKTSLVWEGVKPPYTDELDADIQIVSWDNAYYPFEQAVADGRTVINAQQGILYRVGLPWGGQNKPQSEVYTFDKFKVDGGGEVPPTSTNVVGGLISAWGFNGGMALESMRSGIAPFSAQVWNSADETSFTEFQTRYALSNAIVPDLMSAPQVQPGVYRALDFNRLSTQLGGNGAAVDISVDSTGNPWMLNAAGNLYRWNGTSGVLVPGPSGQPIQTMTDMAVGANGTAAAVLGVPGTVGGPIWVRSSTGVWSDTGGTGKSVAVSSNGDIWAINTSGQIWQFNGTAWVQRPGSGVIITAGANNMVAVVGASGGIHLWQPSNGTWVTLAASGNAEISISSEGEIWALSTSGQVAWRNAAGTWTKPMWSRGAGGYEGIAVGSTGATGPGSQFWVLSH